VSWSGRIDPRRAIEARRSIVACAREYIAAHGAPANLTGFIERLRSEGVLTKTRFGKKLRRSGAASSSATLVEATRR
jgi:hypothetical protein